MKNWFNSLNADQQLIVGGIGIVGGFFGVIMAMTFVAVSIDAMIHPESYKPIEGGLSDAYWAAKAREQEGKSASSSGMQPTPYSVSQEQYDRTYIQFRDSGLNHSDAKRATDAVKSSVESKYR